MKRYISFDFIKGVGILGVVCFHVLNVAFSEEVDKIIAGDAHILLLLLGVVLLYLGYFDGLFILMSAIGNTISTRRQWNKNIEIMDKKPAALKVFKNQAIRGLIIWVFGFISEALLNGLLLDVILGESDIWLSLGNHLFRINVLQTIGIATIIISGIYAYCLYKGWSTKKILILSLTLLIIVLLLRPLVTELGNAYMVDFRSPWNNWINRDLWTNLTYIIIVPFINRFTPLVPFFSLSLFGLIAGSYIGEGRITKNFLKWSYLSALFLLITAIVSGLLLGFDLEGDSLFLFSFVAAGEIAIGTLILQLVDYRGKAEKFGKKTIFFRRFNMLLLTIWSFQWVTIFPVLIFDAVTGWGALDGMLNGYQLLLLLAIVVLFWYIIVKLWEKVEFKGSFEWLTITILSKGRADAGDRLKIQEMLYNPESIVIRENN
jgi:hypothetical protein